MLLFRRLALALVLLALPALDATYEATAQQWLPHDMARPRPPVVEPAPQVLPVPPPADAIILFDGDNLDAWEAHIGGPGAWSVENDYMEVAQRSHRPAPWIVGDGAFQVAPGTGDIRTKQEFGDIQLHVEWFTDPEDTDGGQDRSNSGIFLMGLYEVQVLDSYQSDTYPDGQAAAIYIQHPPLFNAMRPPGQWQAYDIYFRRPRFDAMGNLAEPARVTVVHNGILVQNNSELTGVPLWLQSLPFRPHADRLPIVLQDHGERVRFRNLWVRELPEPPAPPAMAANGGDKMPTFTLPADALDRYVGQYGNWQVQRAGDQLRAHFFGPLALEMVAHSPTHFTLKRTAATIDFALNTDGVPTKMTFTLGGVPMVGERVME